MEMEKLQTYHLTSDGEIDTPINNECDFLRTNEISVDCHCSG